METKERKRFGSSLHGGSPIIFEKARQNWVFQPFGLCVIEGASAGFQSFEAARTKLGVCLDFLLP
jgi:hypothetical protein